MKLKFLKGDSVKVVIGKDKGKVSKISKVYPKLGKVLVDNINQYKRHIKKSSQSDNSQIVTLTKPMNVANVALICPKCNKLTRVGFKVEKGKKMRICRKCGKEV